jgi:hypothetical protein
MSGLRSKFASSSCDTCGDPCEKHLFDGSLRARLHGMFHRDYCETPCTSCGGGCASGACGSTTTTPLPSHIPSKPEEVGKPKEEAPKKMPDGGVKPGTGSTKPGEVSKPILQPATLDITPTSGRSPY